MKKRIFSLMLLLLLFVKAFAQDQSVKNDDVLNIVLKQLKLTKKEIYEPLLREKVLPNQASQTIMVIPKIVINDTNDMGHLSLELDANIVVADLENGKILYHYAEPRAWTSDAMVLTDIVIDTGLYTLNKNTRAFGIRVSYSGSSKPNPYDLTELSLYGIIDRELKRVLKNYPITKYTGEWDTNCAGASKLITRTIGIDQNKTKGLAHLVIKSQIQDSKTFVVNGNCEEKAVHATSSRTLKYDGTEYK